MKKLIAVALLSITLAGCGTPYFARKTYNVGLCGESFFNGATIKVFSDRVELTALATGPHSLHKLKAGSATFPLKSHEGNHYIFEYQNENGDTGTFDLVLEHGTIHGTFTVSSDVKVQVSGSVGNTETLLKESGERAKVCFEGQTPSGDVVPSRS
jgi:hypothetical protein